MERALTRSEARLRSSRVRDNQDGMALYDSKTVLSSPEDRGRDILMRLLQQITAFLERKEMMSTRIAVSSEWSQSRSRQYQQQSRNNLFEVVIEVCEQWMRRLRRATSNSYGIRHAQDWSTQSPRQLVAEAIVQELLVSSMEHQIKEKETMVMGEVQSVEIMRQLHGHLQKDDELVRRKVCIEAGDEQQFNTLQLMLRTDFLEEIASVESPQEKQQINSAANHEASLQFAMETIDDQKKEIVRLRADNERLKDSRLYCNTIQPSFVRKDPDQQLDKALQSACASTQKKGWDGSKSVMDFNRNSDSLLSRKAISTSFSRTLVHSNCGEKGRQQAASLLSLKSQLEQLRAQAERDKDSLYQAEKDRIHFQPDNSALHFAKQKHEKLHQMVLNLTQEKQELQKFNDLEQRSSKRSLCMLQEQLNTLQEQKAYVTQKFDKLKSLYDDEICEKRAMTQKFNDLQHTHVSVSQSMTGLQLQVANLRKAMQESEALVRDRDAALKDAHAKVNVMEQEIAARTLQLQEKDMVVARLKTESGELQRRLDGYKVEKCRSAVEVARPLDTLNGCKRKNKRLETGFEAVQQDKELFAHLQQAQREASTLLVDGFKETRVTFEAERTKHLSTRSECNYLSQSLAEAQTARLACDTEHSVNIKRMQRELDALTQKCSTLEQELKAQKMIESQLEITQQGYATALSKELVDSNIAVQTWMNKYKTAREDKQTVENHVQSLYEEQYRLQQIIKGLYLERRTKCQEGDAKDLTLEHEILSLTKRHRTMKQEIFSAEREKRLLHQLILTLQARPDLQQRVLREMLMTCQRRTEREFCRLSEKVELTLKKLIFVENRYETLQLYLTERKSTCGTILEGDNVATPRIVIVEDDFSNSSFFAHSTSQPAWLEAIAPSPAVVIDTFCHQAIIATETASFVAASELQQWKWKYFAKCLVTRAGKQENSDLVVRLKSSSSAIDHLKKTTRLLTWHKFVTTMTHRRLAKLQHLSAIIARRLLKELPQSQQYRCFEKWKHHVEVFRFNARIRAKANNALQQSISPPLVVALANCIQLLRLLCEPPRNAVTSKLSEQAKSFLDHGPDKSVHKYGADALTTHLTEIKMKIARWKVAADCRIAEFCKQNNQLQVVQRTCADLKALVDLNQRLIEELECRAARQQSVVEAARDFATAYQALSPSARAKVFQSRDLNSASKGIVQGLKSLGTCRSGHQFSQTLGHKTMHNLQVKPTTYKKVLSASAAPTAKTSTDRYKAADERKLLNDSSIELLEEAVWYLKGATRQQHGLQLKIKDDEQSLTLTTKELHKRSMQLLLLRAFLQWKKTQ